ncbi:MAG: TetR/AcrR family transcriptional regulator [Verrucomicrobiota bacterium]
MAIADRKRRAFEAREQLIIAEADDLLATNGYLGLNLDELADRVEYSKATLYHHFSSKEDVVLAVATHHAQHRVDYFMRACLHDGLTRERMLAFGVGDRLLSLQFPHGFPLYQLVRSPSIWTKCSDPRRAQYGKISSHCFELGIKVARDAADRGDLSEWSPDPEQIIWGLVSLSKGAHLLVEETEFEEHGDPMAHLFDNYDRYLDGVGWNPTSRDFDFEAARERVKTEVFGPEFAELLG